MESLANLESFVRSAELGGFSAAARRLGLTPAAVSRNVALLERRLGVRLFQRSTRRLTLTEAGERFLQTVAGPLEGLQAAVAGIAADGGEPAGVLKLSLAPTFGLSHVLPLLPEFLRRCPRVRPEWHFETRPVDLVAEGLDAAIGGGFELSPGVVSRTLAPAHIVAVASPAYLAGRALPADPSGLAALEGIALRSARTGRIRRWTMRDAAGREMAAELPQSLVFNEPAAAREAALLGVGVALLAVPDVLAPIGRGELRRLLPDWWADAGTISLYYPSRALLPAKTRAFVDFMVERFARDGLMERLDAGRTPNPPSA